MDPMYHFKVGRGTPDTQASTSIFSKSFANIFCGLILNEGLSTKTETIKIIVLTPKFTQTINWEGIGKNFTFLGRSLVED